MVAGRRRKNVHELLAEARAGLDRVSPAELNGLMEAGGSADDGRLRVIDVRTRDDREATGVIDGSEHIELSVLEWRIDPESDASEGTAADFGDRLVIVCNEGFSSSQAAARLQEIGFDNATDLEGGMAGWIAHGLPVAAAPGVSRGAAS